MSPDWYVGKPTYTRMLIARGVEDLAALQRSWLTGGDFTLDPAIVQTWREALRIPVVVAALTQPTIAAGS